MMILLVYTSPFPVVDAAPNINFFEISSTSSQKKSHSKVNTRVRMKIAAVVVGVYCCLSSLAHVNFNERT